MSDRTDMQVFRPDGVFPERRPQATPAGKVFVEPQAMPDLSKLWQTLWYRRKLALLVFLAVFLGVAAGTMLQTRIFRATGLLEIRRENADAAPTETLFTFGSISNEHLQTEYGVLKSKALAERVIRQLNLVTAPEFQQPAWRQRLQPAPPPSVRAAVEKFQSLLVVNPVAGSRLVEVQFDSQDPSRAADVVNSVLTNYLSLRAEEGEKASAWLSKQIASTRKKLEDAENRLREYVQSNNLQLLATTDGDAESMVNDRLRQLQAALTEAQTSRFAKESEASFLSKSKDQPTEALDSPVIQDLTVRLAEQKRQYAMLMSNFRPEYPKAKEVKSQIEELESELRREKTRAAARINTTYSAAKRQEEMLRQALAEQQQLANRLAEKSPRYNTLKREVDTNKQLYGVLQQKLKEVGVATALKTTHVGIIDFAQPPGSPEQPKPMLNLALGGALGLLLAVGAAFLRENLDTRLKTVEEVDNMLGLPALGMIPSARSLKAHTIANTRHLPVASGEQRRSAGWYRMDLDPRMPSPLANAFAALRTAVLLRGGENSQRSLLVTSSQPGEGKTTVSVNLTISLARLGKRVLLVDADMRCPSLHSVFKLHRRQGLANYLSGESPWHDLVCDVDGFSVLPSGGPTPHSTELLASSRMAHLMAEARERYDYVVVDSPALFINLADARLLTEVVDGSLLVVRSGFTPRMVALRAAEQASNIIGVVLNDLDLDVLPGYYQNYYQQGHPPASDEEAETVTK
jgi:capsular exopolysaccharide synthesis family protein